LSLFVSPAKINIAAPDAYSEVVASSARDQTPLLPVPTVSTTQIPLGADGSPEPATPSFTKTLSPVVRVTPSTVSGAPVIESGAVYVPPEISAVVAA
jgi:hypothetical protein